METPWNCCVTICQYHHGWNYRQATSWKNINSLGTRSWICNSLLSLYLNLKYRCTDFSRAQLLQQQRMPLGKLSASGETEELIVLPCVLVGYLSESECCCWVFCCDYTLSLRMMEKETKIADEEKFPRGPSLFRSVWCIFHFSSFICK